MKKVAVTGGIAAGKSTFCQMLQELGAITVSQDQIVHQLLSENKALISKLVALFGDEILVNDSIDRKKVAKIVFQSPDAIIALEEHIHPLVRDQVDKLYDEASLLETASLFVVESPLLFETEDPSEYAAVITITCSEEKAQKRTSLAYEDFKKRQRRQLPQEEKKARAQYHIENNGSVEDLRIKAKHIYDELTKSSRT